MHRHKTTTASNEEIPVEIDAQWRLMNEIPLTDWSMVASSLLVSEKGVNGEIRIVSDDGGVRKGVGAGDRRWEAVLLDMGTDHFFLVDAVDRFLAHTEEERGHDDEVEVESGVDANKEAQVVFVGVALERD